MAGSVYTADDMEKYKTVLKKNLSSDVIGLTCM